MVYADCAGREVEFIDPGGVSRCSRCQGTMQRVALVRAPEAITALLPYAEADGEARGPP